MSSKVWIFLSDCPCICEWKAMLKCNLVPNASCKFFQKCDVKRGSRSDTIDIGTPCNLTISEIYKDANLSKESICCIGKKCADLVSQSTITHTALCFWNIHGNSITKSIIILSYFHSSIFNDCDFSAGAWCSAFTCWHVKYLAMYSTTSFFIVGHR